MYESDNNSFGGIARRSMSHMKNVRSNAQKMHNARILDLTNPSDRAQFTSNVKKMSFSKRRR